MQFKSTQRTYWIKNIFSHLHQILCCRDCHFRHDCEFGRHFRRNSRPHELEESVAHGPLPFPTTARPQLGSGEPRQSGLAVVAWWASDGSREGGREEGRLFLLPVLYCTLLLLPHPDSRRPDHNFTIRFLFLFSESSSSISFVFILLIFRKARSRFRK